MIHYHRFFSEEPKLSGLQTIVSLVRGTCNYRAAQFFARDQFEQQPLILEANNFDEAADLASRTRGAFLLLPHLHPKNIEISHRTDWQLEYRRCFALSNPPLYLASGSKRLEGEECACLPTLRTLLAGEEYEFMDVNNTQQAAALVAEGRSRYCVTNEDGLRAQGLHIDRELKRITVIWMPHIYVGER